MATATRYALTVEVPTASVAEAVFTAERGPSILEEFLLYNHGWLSEEAGVLTQEQRGLLGSDPTFPPADLTPDQQAQALRYELHLYLVAPYNLDLLNKQMDATKENFNPVLD